MSALRWLAGVWTFWVRLCGVRESPLVLALLRMGVAVVLLWDLLWIGMQGLPVLLWAPVEAGGVIDVLAMKKVPPVYLLMDPALAEAWGASVAWGLWFGCVAALAAFGAGVLTRFSGLAFVLLYAQTAWINDASDRGIDRMLRIVLLLLIVSGSGRTLSVDARVRSGSWLGDGLPVSALPRYLILGQLLLMYWCAGMEKFAMSWFPWGGYGALYLILQDPVLGIHDGAIYAQPGLYQLTQLGTAVSHAWEWLTPLMLLVYWYRSTRTRPGRLRAWCNANDVRLIYVAIGVVFHLCLAATLRLGIFPWAMLALYPVFFHPDEVRGLVRRAMRTLPIHREVRHASSPG